MVDDYIDIFEDAIDYELEFDNDTFQIIDVDYKVIDTLEIINENNVCKIKFPIEIHPKKNKKYVFGQTECFK